MEVQMRNVRSKSGSDVVRCIASHHRALECHGAGVVGVDPSTIVCSIAGDAAIANNQRPAVGYPTTVRPGRILAHDATTNDNGAAGDQDPSPAKGSRVPGDSGVCDGGVGVGTDGYAGTTRAGVGRKPTIADANGPGGLKPAALRQISMVPGEDRVGHGQLTSTADASPANVREVIGNGAAAHPKRAAVRDGSATSHEVDVHRERAIRDDREARIIDATREGDTVGQRGVAKEQGP